MNTVALVAYWCAAIPAIAFPIVYTFLAPWWRTQIGRHLFTFGTVVGAVFLLGALFRILGPAYPGRTGLRLGMYLGIAVVLSNHLRLLITSQIRRRRRAGDTERAES